MSKSHNTVVQDPRTPANLKRLTTVSIRCDVTGVAFLGVSPVRLKKTARELLQDEGLTVDNASKSRLVLGIAAEVRDVGKHTAYAVEVALREPVALPRAANPLQMGEVDTWRHQTITGILFAPYDEAQLSKALVGEAIRQVGVFLEDWATANEIELAAAEAADTILATATLDPPHGDWYGRAQRVEQQLKALVEQLAHGPHSRATLDKFVVRGTKVDYQATVTNSPLGLGIAGADLADVLPTKSVLVGSFDMADPASVSGRALTAPLPPGLDRESVSVSLELLAPLFAQTVNA